MLIIKLGISLNQRWYDWGSTAYIYISLRTTLTKGISIWLLISSSTPLVRPKSAIPPLLETTRVSDIIVWECPRPPNLGGGGGVPAHHKIGRSYLIPVNKDTNSKPPKPLLRSLCVLTGLDCEKVPYRELTGDHDQMECSEKLLPIYSRFSFLGNVSSMF